MADKEDQVHLDAEKARAGATPGMTRYILAVSLVLVVIVLAVLLLWGRFV